jgi:hypothetical protein
MRIIYRIFSGVLDHYLAYFLHPMIIERLGSDSSKCKNYHLLGRVTAFKCNG